MACYHPMFGHMAECQRTGKKSFSKALTKHSQPVTLPCGQCIGCRIEQSRQWAIRCMHETSLHDHNSFITLTYDNANLPPGGSLDKTHYQKFMRRLRKAIVPELIRFYHCGEYGEKFKRPHYHAIIFGYDFPDKIIHSENFRGEKLYTSEQLSTIWGKGHCLIGDVTFDSAAYVARYCTKKKNGKLGLHHYNDVDASTGEITNSIQPEYATMSRKPGIAHGWFTKWNTDVYPSDTLVMKTPKGFKEMRPPTYYDTLYELENPIEFEKIKEKRAEGFIVHAADNTKKRLAVKKYVKEKQLKQLHRNYENASP